MTTHDDEAADVRYLLGLLPEEEHARIERALLEDEEAFERVLALEDELFHDYAHGGLGPEERRRFEARFLASEEGRRRLADARALLAGVHSRAPRRAPFASWLLPAAAVLAVAAGGLWLFSRRDPVGEARVTPPSAAPATTRVALALTPGLVRDVSASPRRAQLRPDDVLVLTLTLPTSAVPPRLLARVLSAEGREVWRTSPLVVAPSSPGSVVVEVPPGVLPQGDYQLVLAAEASPADEVADYAFGILRR